MSYEDILYRTRPMSAKRAPMSMMNRAAQFAPFAALTGYEELVRETARYTDRPLELTDSAVAELDAVLQGLTEGMTVKVTAFVPDARKEGGTYVTRCGILRRVDASRQCLMFTDGTDVPFRFLATLEVVD